MTTSEAHELPTEEEVYDHIRSIAPRYRRCAAGDHNWKMTEGAGYTAGGRAFRGSDLSRAAWFECTDTCVPDEEGERGCGRQRGYEMEYDARRGRLVRTTVYSYSNMNPELASPKGISFTGINVRSEMPDVMRDDQVRRQLLQVTAVKGAA
ncbi:hypothetical protein ACLGIH_20540 [Streptomyces sp. HMX87]|uniref:hypothetical protein n=1 Tax=Streptomyces sp. HMX87 TaxID=3390849 RepID=UPI003A8A5980